MSHSEVSPEHVNTSHPNSPLTKIKIKKSAQNMLTPTPDKDKNIKFHKKDKNIEPGIISQVISVKSDRY
jgi:hypothetical protein